MLASEYLSLASVRLKAREKWATRTAGFTFIFLEAGGGQCLWRKGSQNLLPGDVLVINAASGAQISRSMMENLAFSFFCVSSELLYPLFGAKELTLFQGMKELFQSARVYPGAWAVAGKCHRLLREVQSEVDIDHRAQLLRIVAAILSFELKSARPRRSEFIRMDGRMREIFDTLSTKEILSLPVTKLAGRFNCTRRHLTRLFQQQFGCSVANLRMEIRLLRAASLLRNPQGVWLAGS